MNKNRRTILFLLIGCTLLAGVLVAWTPAEPMKNFVNETEFNQYVLKQIYDFGYKNDRVRTRNIEVNDRFSRFIITVDVPSDFPQTLFHKTLSDSLRTYGISTYAVRNLPDPTLEIHLINRNTVVTTIRLQRTTPQR